MDEYISLGYLLNNAARLAKRDLTNRMQSLGLTFPQWTVLRDLSEHEMGDPGNLTMAAIARRLKTNRPNIKGMLDRLETMGLVRRTVNPKNRRAHTVSLTNKAREVMAELLALSQQTSAKALHNFSPHEETAVKDFLGRIIVNLHETGIENDLEGRDST